MAGCTCHSHVAQGADTFKLRGRAHCLCRHRHSRYWRCLQDLPIQGTPVLIRLHVGRWRCRNADHPEDIQLPIRIDQEYVCLIGPVLLRRNDNASRLRKARRSDLEGPVPRAFADHPEDIQLSIRIDQEYVCLIGPVLLRYRDQTSRLRKARWSDLDGAVPVTLSDDPRNVELAICVDKKRSVR
jgi:hypothetical protein